VVGHSLCIFWRHHQVVKSGLFVSQVDFIGDVLDGGQLSVSGLGVDASPS
jgi:hypothetical protein